MTRVAETLLFQAYGLGIRAVQCACGGFVGAYYGEEGPAVLAHSRSELRLMWRAWMDLASERCALDGTDTAEQAPRDLSEFASGASGAVEGTS